MINGRGPTLNARYYPLICFKTHILKKRKLK